MSEAKILVVDDEPQIRRVMRTTLTSRGYAILEARSGEQAMEMMRSERPDLVVLDVNMPGMGGLEACREIRRNSDVPVIVLTVRHTEQDKVRALDAGADDYVVKPFSPRELMARLRAHLRRTDPQSERLIQGDIVLDRAGRVVSVDGGNVELTGKEFDLLAYLLENRGRVLTRDLLLDRVWGLEFPGGTRTVDVHIGQLRRKLGRPDLIRTVRGVGYKAV
jgi:DNA-binding response OmpR family regulator